MAHIRTEHFRSVWVGYRASIRDEEDRSYFFVLSGAIENKSVVWC